MFRRAAALQYMLFLGLLNKTENRNKKRMQTVKKEKR